MDAHRGWFETSIRGGLYRFAEKSTRNRPPLDERRGGSTRANQFVATIAIFLLAP
jgi:hypothetical protein